MTTTSLVQDYLGNIPASLFGENDTVHKVLSREDIMEFIPERDSALFAEKAVIIQTVNGGGSIVLWAIVSMPITDFYCAGHMPGYPILPLGVGGWMLSQAGEILAAYAQNYYGQHSTQRNVPLVIETGPVLSKNRDFLIPGDTMITIARIKRHRLSIYEIDTEAWLGNQQVVCVPDMKYAVVGWDQFVGKYPSHEK